jgi:predicted GNAT superfamily acetyltransferase
MVPFPISPDLAGHCASRIARRFFYDRSPEESLVGRMKRFGALCRILHMKMPEPMGRLVAMRPTLQGSDVASRAAGQARDAAGAAGIDVREVHSLEDIRSVSELFDRVWGSKAGDPLMAPGMLRALTHAGNYAAGAFVDGTMIGAVTAFMGTDGDGPYLHSHILGVEDGHRGGHIGFALKQHQRAWVLANGMTKVTWTFDPLVRKNAFFNVQKLGAEAGEYLVRFYGTMHDEINAGDETDRLLIVWDVDSEHVEHAAAGKLAEPNVAVLREQGASIALDENGEVVRDGWNGTVLCATPDDIVELRHRDPDGARTWRTALRDTLGKALDDGYRVTGFTRSGWYVLERA